MFTTDCPTCPKPSRLHKLVAQGLAALFLGLWTLSKYESAPTCTLARALVFVPTASCKHIYHQAAHSCGILFFSKE